jgi:Uma2 family endonuclease
VTLEDSEPEPDGAVARGAPRDYLDRHPGPADVVLAIEVADTTLQRDRGIKLRIYAGSGIPVYWIVNLAERRVAVYTQPDSRTADPTYGNVKTYEVSDTVPVVIDGAEAGSIAVARLLPDA